MRGGGTLSVYLDYYSGHFLMRKEGSTGPDVMKATMDAVVAQYAALMPDIYKVTSAEFSEVIAG